MAPAAWIFFGVIAALVLRGLYEFGVVQGVQTEVAARLPGGTFVRDCVLKPDLLIDRLFDRIAANPLRWAIRSFLLAYVGGGVMFSLLEPKASVFDGLWWAWITVFTVGYGDLSPGEWVMRSLAYGVVALGWFSIVVVLPATLAGRIAERRIHRANETPELHDDVEALCAELTDLTARLSALGGALRDKETNPKGGR